MKSEYKLDIVSLLIVVVTLTILSIGALILSNFMGEFGTDLRETAQETLDNQTYANQSTEFLANDVTPFADNYVFWFFIATFIGIILLGLYLEFEPAVMIVIFIVGCIVVLLAWIGSNIHTEFAEDMPVASSGMSKTGLLMGSPYFPIFIFVCLLILMIIMYSRKRGDQQ